MPEGSAFFFGWQMAGLRVFGTDLFLDEICISLSICGSRKGFLFCIILAAFFFGCLFPGLFNASFYSLVGRSLVF